MVCKVSDDDLLKGRPSAECRDQHGKDGDNTIAGHDAADPDAADSDAAGHDAAAQDAAGHDAAEYDAAGDDVLRPTELDLEEYLIRQLLYRNNGIKLIGRNWHVVAGLDNEGRGDLAFECGSGVDLVVEAKYLRLDEHGRNACTKRRKKRRKVARQAIDYAVKWHEKAGGSRSVIAAIYTNEHGLVELAWLLGRRSLGRKMCVLRCRELESEVLQPGGLDYVTGSLRDAGFVFWEL
ncbi:hypothetical protein PLESTM_000633600 [Pleodorina starrii]|nr:hypothetical protein PLESTM_000633600 [Pleodorina starrii]